MNPTALSPEPTARHGKIARLPLAIREELNRRLQNGEEGTKLLDWLNSLAETQAILQADFAGKTISQQNLSNWRLGGYRDWEVKDQTAEIIRAFTAEAPELQSTQDGLLGQRLSLCITAQVARALRRLSALDDDPDRQAELLANLCQQLALLRRGDHNAQWIQVHRDRLALELQKYKAWATRQDNKTQPSKTEAMTLEDFDQFEKDHHLT